MFISKENAYVYYLLQLHLTDYRHSWSEVVIVRRSPVALHHTTLTPPCIASPTITTALSTLVTTCTWEEKKCAWSACGQCCQGYVLAEYLFISKIYSCLMVLVHDSLLLPEDRVPSQWCFSVLYTRSFSYLLIWVLAIFFIGLLRERKWQTWVPRSSHDGGYCYLSPCGLRQITCPSSQHSTFGSDFG